MTTPSTPPEPATVARDSSRRFRPGRRGLLIGAGILALLVVAGVAAALLIPRGGPWRGGYGPDIGPDRTFGDLRGPDRFGGPPWLGETDELGGGGPRGDRGDGPWAWDRNLGDDTLVAGTVVSTADGSIVVTPDGGPQRTIRTDDRTRVGGNGNSGLGDLQAGERVVIRVSGTGDAATAVAITAAQSRVTGTVTALNGTSATITTIGGLTVSADTAALSQQPAVGDLVTLTGTGTGTTITADGIRVLSGAG